MLHKLLLLVFLSSATVAMAQGNNTPAPEIDYKQPGAPLPPLRYIVYHDSAQKKSTNDTGVIMQTNAVATQDGTVAATKKHNRKKSKHTEAENINTASARLVTNDDLDNGANLFVMMFNPTCSHCQAETVLFENNSALFKQSKIVLLASPVMKPYLNDFITYTHVDKYASFMYLGIDSSDFIKKVFLYQALPQINIYDKHRKLIKTYSSEVAIDSLKKYIE